jgi:uncharacterized alkaline shock family protein YloU
MQESGMMTEREDRRRFDSPLESDRGVTTVGDAVVSRLAGMAAGEVEGVHIGGSVSRAAGSILESITGSDSQRRGVSVEVGLVETAIDLTMGIEYGNNILELAERVRSRITERVESLTGLRVAELNVTVSDIIFPDGEEHRRPTDEDRPQAGRAEQSEAADATTHIGGSLSEEPLRAQHAPDEDETRELRLGDEVVEDRPQATEDQTGRERRRDG